MTEASAHHEPAAAMHEAIAQAFRAACHAELQALKPGNVHVHAPGHGMTTADFEASAAAAAPHIAEAGATVGRRILGAVRATRQAVGQNTNLGIVLLCAPLALAAGIAAGQGGDLRPAPADAWDVLGDDSRAASTADGHSGDTSATPDAARHTGGQAQTPSVTRLAAAQLRRALDTVLAALDVEDAAQAFQAIALANPGGLGEAPQADVREPPHITLLEAMRLAAPRDRIAYQYASGFADIFDTGLPVARAAASQQDAAADVYWRFLTTIADSHVARKYGSARAQAVLRLAQHTDTALQADADVAARQACLLALDARLKAEGINPGTSADLTVATLFAQALLNLAPAST
jgi:triphosphoribosyl-dephospho-CoA synthase